jgi:hypothetical protein
VLLLATVSAGAAVPSRFFTTYCADCHDDTTQKAEINLEAMPQEWAKHFTVAQWERVLRVIESGEMPPKKKSQPEAKEREEAAAALRAVLAEKSPVGGTVLQRLNRVQYANTIQKVLSFPFRLPASFPTDTPLHGFDRVAEGLVLSGPLMEQYLEVATAVADEVIPPPAQQAQVKAAVALLKPADFSVSFEGSKLIGEGDEQRLRLVSRNEVLIRSSTWANRFEAKHTGEYEIRLRLGAYKPKGEEPLKAHLLAVKSGSDFVSVKSLRKLAELEVPAEGHRDFTVNATLNRGETFAVYWANAPFGWDRDGDAEAWKQLHERFTDRKLYTAWLKLGSKRGRSASDSWIQLKALMAGGELDLKDPRLASPPTRYNVVLQNELQWIFECMHHDLGPALDIHAASLRGPLTVVADETDQARQQRSAKFLGQRGSRTDEQWCRDVLRPFLTRAFRRPVSDVQLEKFTQLAMGHITAGHRFEEAMHLAIRAALTSPDFLYLCSKPGKLDDFDLATRLSYFLTSSPPDEKLMKLAAAGKLADAKTLEAETKRLLGQRGSGKSFVTDFTSQWLGTRLLPDIMPDARLLKFTEQDMKAMIDETEMFFAEVLHNNLPIETFIAPDFTFMNRRLAQSIYRFDLPSDAAGGKKSGKAKTDEMQRVSLPREGRIGGILGQASVMMATANGVDTQPVLRGVWLLENVFGTPPPPPPKNVPAIPPDTAGASTIRERLAAHQADASCAGCHAKIDPPGFALENFDPVGRWREFYPVFEKDPAGEVITRKGAAVDANGTMPDGTSIKDVTDLKRYLLQHPDLFARCLTTKLLTYATGRPMSYGDTQIAEQIVRDLRQRGNGLTDLIIAVVQSEAFRTR